MNNLDVTICIPSYPNDPYIAKLMNILQGEGCTILHYERGTFAQNCNAMAKDAKTEYVLFLNNDTEPEPGFVGKMLNSFEKEDEWVVGPKIVFLKNVVKHVIYAGQVIHNCGIKGKVQCGWVDFNEQFMPYEFGRGMDVEQAILRSRRRVPAISGCVMMIKREKFLQLGGFDEKFRNGWEDNDFNLKVLEAGACGVYEPSAVVRHHFAGSDSIGRFDDEDANVQYFMSKWGSKRPAIIKQSRERIAHV